MAKKKSSIPFAELVNRLKTSARDEWQESIAAQDGYNYVHLIIKRGESEFSRNLSVYLSKYKNGRRGFDSVVEDTRYKGDNPAAYIFGGSGSDQGRNLIYSKIKELAAGVEMNYEIREF
jgi:hypothetical protein